MIEKIFIKVFNLEFTNDRNSIWMNPPGFYHFVEKMSHKVWRSTSLFRNTSHMYIPTKYFSYIYTFDSHQVLTDCDREKNAASNKPIFDESKSDIHGSLGQKLIFRAPKKCFRSLFFFDDF